MKSLPTTQYVSTHDYSPINNAVDVEIQKRKEITGLYSSQRSMNRSAIVLNVCVALCLLVLTISLVYWFFFTKPVVLTAPPFQDKNASTSLKTISNNDDALKDPIDTSFTVFYRYQIETGEHVVTGLNYVPSDLITPQDQYCYIEPMTADSGLAGEPIASMVITDLTIETTDKFLIEVALPHCKWKY